MSIALGQRVETTTQTRLLPKVVDTILNTNVFLTRMLTSAKPWVGRKMKKAIKYTKGNAGSSFSGMDTFSTAASETRVNMEYDPAFYEINVTLPLTELAVNKTEEGVTELMSLEMASRAEDMADELGDIFYSDGTGNDSKDPLGLEALVDDGTNAATIGGLSRTTYSTLNSTVTASGGTLTLAKLDTLWDAVSSGSQEPTVGVTTETIFSLYGQLLRPQERINKTVGMTKGMSAGTGFTGLDYKGKAILKDEKCTSGVLYFLNEDYIEWRALSMPETTPVKFKATDIEGNDYSEVIGLGFSWSGWIKPINQAAIVGHIYLGGELVGWNPKRSGKLTGISGI